MPRLFSRRLAAVLLLAALHMLAFDRGLGGDGWASFAALESLVDDSDLHLENNLRGVTNGIVPTPSGHLAMQYPPGILLLDLPPFLAGRAADTVLPGRWLARGVELPPVGRVPRRVFLEAAAIVLARNLATLLGLFWLALGLRRLGWSEGIVAAAVAATFFGGPLLFYSLVGMTHAPTFALASLLFFLLVRYREKGSRRQALAAGAVLGLSALVRYGAVGLLPAAACAILAGGSRPRGERLGGLRALIAFGAGFVPPLLLLPFYWHAGSGTWRPTAYGGDWRITLASPWNVLLSPHHGLFVFHPALLLAALGLAWVAGSELIGAGASFWGGRGPREVLLPRDAPLLTSPLPQPPPAQGGGTRPPQKSSSALAPMGVEAHPAPGMGIVAFLALLGTAILYGWWSEWANPGGYGQRFLTDALPFLGLGFAHLLGASAQRARRVARFTICVATAFGYLLFFAAVTGLVRPPAPDPWPQRLADYRALLTSPPGPAEIWAGMERASVVLRLGAGGMPLR